MSLYMSTDKPKPASRSRVATSKDLLSSSDALNKVVPRNPKFAHVKATINTGANTGNVKPKIDRSGEMFRRVNRRQLHQLMLACEKGDESIYELQENWDEVEDNDDLASVRSGRTISSQASASSTTSNLPMVVATHTQQLDSKQSQANDYFILLDTRDDEAQYAKYHIQGAIHYPPAMLRRDHFPPALYAMKNAPNKLIILYDSDETSRIALECCSLFIQKGFSNAFLLTGGIKHFADKYSSRLVGESPPKPKPSPATTSSVSSRSQALAGAPASARLNTGSSASNFRLNTGSVSSRPSARPSAPVSSAGNRPMSGAPGSSAGNRPPSTPQLQSHSATSLGFVQPSSQRERNSPRESLRLTQQQQSNQPQSQQFSPPASSSGTRSQRGSGGQPISARAFR